MTSTSSDIWVFGYGSLIWRPDFEHAEFRRARLHGYHRDLCVYSVEHRGTIMRPGLVFGMDRGGTCDGVALRVPAGDAEPVVRALRVREQVTGVYRERVRPVTLQTDAEHRDLETVNAVCYVVDPLHRQYAGGLPYRAQADIVRGAVGKAGPNISYVRNTMRALDALGIRDRHLERLMVLMGRNRLNVAGDARSRLSQRLQQIAYANGSKHGPRWSVRARADLELNHRKNLGY